MRFLLTVLIAACAFGAAALGPSHAQTRRDYCALPGGAASLMLIDRTSPYTTSGEDHAGERIAAGIDAIFPSLRTGDRVTVATIERHRRLSLLAFDKCLPGCGPRETSPIPFLSNCPQATIENERRNFRTELYAAVIPLLQNAQDQPNSDITGTIFQSTNQHAFTRIYLFSDMLENSQVLPWAQFASQPAEQSLAAVQRSGFVPTLRNAQVQIVGFGLSHARNRPALTDAQDRNIRHFWELYFGASGAPVSYRTAITP